MKKNTEIKIEIDDSGAWRAESPDYPGWKAEGKESSGCADSAAKDLEEWVNSRICPICGRRYSAPPATSRVNGADICPVCGAAEAVGFLEEREKIIEAVEKAEIAAGRFEAVDKQTGNSLTTGKRKTIRFCGLFSVPRCGFPQEK